MHRSVSPVNHLLWSHRFRIKMSFTALTFYVSQSANPPQKTSELKSAGFYKFCPFKPTFKLQKKVSNIMFFAQMWPLFILWCSFFLTIRWALFAPWTDMFAFPGNKTHRSLDLSLNVSGWRIHPAEMILSAAARGNQNLSKD